MTTLFYLAVALGALLCLWLAIRYLERAGCTAINDAFTEAYGGVPNVPKPRKRRAF